MRGVLFAILLTAALALSGCGPTAGPTVSPEPTRSPEATGAASAATFPPEIVPVKVV